MNNTHNRNGYILAVNVGFASHILKVIGSRKDAEIMKHSIISFEDIKGVLIDFYRLKPKRPETVLNIVFRGFREFENLYLKNLNNRCSSVLIHYTDYETTPENLTFRCTFEEFMKRYNDFKQVI